ncbi:unnamed protein product [Amoebophrya sp. A25]|nr:unnamed protein product [Amoebophrya sp. A25]|eukprot:GSA25T00002473001.1
MNAHMRAVQRAASEARKEWFQGSEIVEDRAKVVAEDRLDRRVPFAVMYDAFDGKPRSVSMRPHFKDGDDRYKPVSIETEREKRLDKEKERIQHMLKSGGGGMQLKLHKEATSPEKAGKFAGAHGPRIHSRMDRLVQMQKGRSESASRLDFSPAAKRQAADLRFRLRREQRLQGTGQNEHNREFQKMLRDAGLT